MLDLRWGGVIIDGMKDGWGLMETKEQDGWKMGVGEERNICLLICF